MSEIVKKTPTVYLICGFIGAGKTTFSKKLEKETGALRITKDEWMVRIFGNVPVKDDFETLDTNVAQLATDFAFQLVENYLFYLINPEIEKYGLTPYKAESNKLENNRIVIGKTSLERE